MNERLTTSRCGGLSFSQIIVSGWPFRVVEGAHVVRHNAEGACACYHHAVAERSKIPPFLLLEVTIVCAVAVKYEKQLCDGDFLVCVCVCGC